MWLESGLEWVKAMLLLQVGLRLVSHHLLGHLAHKRYVSDWMKGIIVHCQLWAFDSGLDNSFFYYPPSVMS